MARRAVFLDRDGVLIRDVHLLTHPRQIELCASAPWALRQLHDRGFLVVVVSNQTVVARGLATEQDVETVHASIQKLLGGSDRTKVDRFYFCPHHPSATLHQYRASCDCRKPRPGMLLQAAADLDLDLAASYLVGDRISDIVAGNRVGCRTVLVKTGMHSKAPIESSDGVTSLVEPDYVCADVAEAVKLILGFSPK